MSWPPSTYYGPSVDWLLMQWEFHMLLAAGRDSPKICFASTFPSPSFSHFPNPSIPANRTPSARPPTRASMTYPSASSFLHSVQRFLTGMEKISMNSFSSSSGFRFEAWFAGLLRSMWMWIRRVLVFVKPGSDAGKSIREGRKVNSDDGPRWSDRRRGERRCRDSPES